MTLTSETTGMFHAHRDKRKKNRHELFITTYETRKDETFVTFKFQYKIVDSYKFKINGRKRNFYLMKSLYRTFNILDVFAFLNFTSFIYYIFVYLLLLII